MINRTISTGLVYIGKVVSLESIPDADFILSAAVVCGKGGKWKGIVRKDQFVIGDLCNVFLPDAQIPPNGMMKFMESSNWRVKMRRFRGAASEVVIMPLSEVYRETMSVGEDVTANFGVTKYFKPIPANLACDAKGDFPSFIPKTDELNYQRHFELVEQLHGQPYYITEKADGSSTTAFRYKGEFGLCSRNYELLPNENNGYWQVASKFRLQSRLPEGIALQWETCGPKIQSNPMGFSEVTGLAFSAYDIENHKYLEMQDFVQLCKDISFPMVKIIHADTCFDKDAIETLGEGKYDNGKEREGVVVRSKTNVGHAPISFKVINLNYEK